MSPVLVVLVVAAVGLIGFGMQVSAHQIQRFPVDNRNPGPLVDTTRTHRFVVRPAELEQLHSIVTESLASPAVANAKLQPLLAQLDAEAPGRPRAPSPAVSGRRRSRVQWLDQELAVLESRWGLDRSDESAGSGITARSPAGRALPLQP